MAVTDWKFAGTAANVGSDVDWTNYTYAKVEDGSFAHIDFPGNDISNWLRLTNFGFTAGDIPAGATIDGIEVRIRRLTYSGGWTYVGVLHLRDAGGQTGDNKGSSNLWDTSWEYRTYGGSSDTWNAGLSQSDIITSTFGIDYKIQNVYGGTPQARIDVIAIRVYYTPPGPVEVSGTADGVLSTSISLSITKKVSGQANGVLDTALIIGLIKEASGQADGVLSASLALSLGKIEEVSGTANGVLSASLSLGLIRKVSGITANPTSLVTNGNMELDSDWGNFGTPAANVRSNEQAHSLTYSRKVTLDGSGGYAGIYQTITELTLGKTYIYSAWFKGLDMVAENFRISCLTGIHTPVSNGTWVRLEYTFTATNTTQAFYIYILDDNVANAGKSFYVDDASVREIYGALSASLILGLIREVSGQANGKLSTRIHLSISGEEITDGIMRGY